MDPVLWLRELPEHVREALGSLRVTNSGLALRRIVLALLLILTALATGIGLNDLIEAGDAGDVGIIEPFIVVALAFGAILTMWLALEFAIEARRWQTRVMCFLVYIFFALWSVGFGFGFYWKHMASVGQAQSDMSHMVAQVATPLRNASSSLTAITGQIENLERQSQAKQQAEDTSGGSCGVSSLPGKGPYYRTRKLITDGAAAQTQGLRTWLNGGQADPQGGSTLSDDLAALQKDLTRIQSQKQGSVDALRSNFIAVRDQAQGLIGDLNATLAGASTRAEQLQQFAVELKKGVRNEGVVCVDTQLGEAFTSAAQELRAVKPIATDLSDVEPNLGAKATQHAFFRLWRNALNLLPGIEIQGLEPLNDRDFIALIAAIVVDIGIAFLTLLGRTRNMVGGLSEVLRLPLRDTETRRRLFALLRMEGEPLSRAFDQSIAQCRGSYFLIASPDLPELYSSIRNLQSVLRASGDGTPISPGRITREALSRTDREFMVTAFQERLATAANELRRQRAQVMPSAFPPENMSVLRLRSNLVLALNLVFGAAPPAQDRDDPGVEAPQRRGAGYAPRQSANARPRGGDPRQAPPAGDQDADNPAEPGD